MDHIGHALDVAVEALHRVVGRIEAQALLGVAEPADTGAECVGQAVDGGGQGGDLRFDPQGLAELGHDPVPLSRLEMGEIALPVVHRLIAVSDPHLIHLLEEVVVDGAEAAHRIPDLLLVQSRVFLPQVPDHGPPLLQGLAVPGLHPATALLQVSDVVLRLSQQLHSMGLGNGVSLGHLPAQAQLPDLVPVLVLHAVGCRRPLVDRGKVGADNLLRQLLIRHDVPDIPLHGLPGVEDALALVLPVVGGVQQAVRLRQQLGLPGPVPLPELAGQALILPLRLIDRRDPSDIVPPGVQVLRFDLPLEQPPHLDLVVVRQEIFRRHTLITPPGALQVTPHLGDLLCRRLCLLPGRRPGLTPALSLLDIPPHGPQFPDHAVYDGLEIVLGPGLEGLRLPAVVLVQALLHPAEVLRHLSDPLQLVRRVGQFRREELRPVVGELLVDLIHIGISPGPHVQPAEMGPPPLFKIGDVRRVVGRDGEPSVAEEPAQIVVLLRERLIRFHALLVGPLKEAVCGLLGNRAPAQILTGDLRGNVTQKLPLGPPWDAKKLSHLVYQPPLHASEIGLGLHRHCLEGRLRLLLPLAVLADGVASAVTVREYRQVIPDVRHGLPPHLRRHLSARRSVSRLNFSGSVPIEVISLPEIIRSAQIIYGPSRQKIVVKLL